jgi:hypothetical protein
MVWLMESNKKHLLTLGWTSLLYFLILNRDNTCLWDSGGEIESVHSISGRYLYKEPGGNQHQRARLNKGRYT